MQHLERIIWKEPNWLPESPDQYPDGLPPAKPETWMVPMESVDHWWEANTVLFVVGLQMGQTMHLVWYESEEIGGAPGAEVPAGVGGKIHVPGEWPPGDPTGVPRTWYAARHVTIPADKGTVLGLVDALLYVQRRTHEHDWEGDDGQE